MGSWFKDNLLTKENINAGVNLGLTALNNKIQSKQNAIQSESMVLTQKQDDIRQNAGVQAKVGMSTTTILLIVGGLVAVGAVIYFATRKK